MQETYIYNKNNILQDYARGALGAAITGGPLFWLGVHPIIMPLFLGGFGLFAFFLVKTFLRQKTVLSIDTNKGELIETSLYTKKIDLNNLEFIKLRYFTTKRRSKKSALHQEPTPEKGWFSLKLCDKKKNKMTIESSLEDFQGFLDNLVPYLKTVSIHCNPVTMSNFEALGYDIGHL